MLQQLADSLNDVVRIEERVYRWGGEEFALITLDSSQNGASLLAERLRKQVADYKFEVSNGHTIKATVSLGVACYKPKTHDCNTNLFNVADKALYEAKTNGRNQVVCKTLE